MKNPLHVLLLAVLCAIPAAMCAQAPFTVMDSLDVNNIKVAHDVHGGMWHDQNSHAFCEFPKGSGKHIGFAAGLWMGGFDAAAQLSVSAHTYGGNNDYWPGPVPISGMLSYAESEKWARIWKVTKESLDTFFSLSVHTLVNTPRSILEWPGKGNIYATGYNNVPLGLSPTNYLPVTAPFVNVGGNPQVYEPLLGDYPLLKGDAMLWNTYTDVGPTHNETNTPPLRIQVACMTYGYKRNSIIDNVIFYEYLTYNANSVEIDSFTISLFADLDLGYGFDDYIGYDSTRSLGIIYNGGTNDTKYQDTIPMAGVRVLQWDFLDTCGTFIPAGSAMYNNNSAHPVTGSPTSGSQYYNYMTGSWRNGTPLVDGGNGTGPGVQVKYVYPGNPNTAEWSECGEMNPPGDRRIIISRNLGKLMPGQVNRFAFALVASPPKFQNGCPNADFTDIRAVSDTAEKYFCNPLLHLGVRNIPESMANLMVYPNPATSEMILDVPFAKGEEVLVYDATGRRVHTAVRRNGEKLVMDVNGLADGVYLVWYQSTQGRRTATFVKQ